MEPESSRTGKMERLATEEYDDLSLDRPERFKILSKVFCQNKTLSKVFESVLPQKTFVSCCKTFLCIAIRLTIAITSVPYVPYNYANNS